MAVSIIWNWKKAAAAKAFTTVGELYEFSKRYRHPDSVHTAYSFAVENPIGQLPDRDYRIAIVGGGAAGVAALYELSQLAKNLSDPYKINVTIFEADPNSFLTEIGKKNAKDIDVRGKKAGRVSAANAGGNTIYEVGAMRFPEIASLTWHYAQRAFSPDETVTVFPNPGKVPTEFVFGDRVDRYELDEWLDSNSPTLRVKNIVIARFMGLDPESMIPDNNARVEFPIGDMRPLDVLSITNSTSPPLEKYLDKVDENWKKFIASYDGKTLESAVREILSTAQQEGLLPSIDGFEPGSEEQLNYCVELFGRFGFGTGGFKPLFHISLVEMMRLLLWDYSNEYTLPVPENVQFIAELYREAIREGAGKLEVEAHQVRRVCDVAKTYEAPSAEALVYYYALDESGTPPSELQRKAFDYVILALPQDQLLPLISRVGYSPNAKDTCLGDEGLGLPTLLAPRIFPALQLSLEHEAPNARIATAISQLHMTYSSKVFGTMTVENANKAPEFGSGPIRAVVSDCGLAASYVVPSSIKPDSFYSLLASYTWQDDTIRLQRDFGRYPQNPPSNEEASGADYMFKTMINRATRDVKDPADNQYKRWWFASFLASADPTDRFVFDWTTNQSAGGFKLDHTGDHKQSNLCFRYHTHAWDRGLDNRFFLASDSYSHLGGWLEGAFMSAVNAVAGLVFAANDADENALNPEARTLLTKLDAIVPRQRPAAGQRKTQELTDTAAGS